MVNVALKSAIRFWAAALIMFGVPVAAQAEDAPAHIIVGLDLSSSNPLVDDAAYAAKIADRIAPYIEQLPIKSKLTLRTLGNYGGGGNNLRLDRVISTKDRAEDVARLVKGIVAGVPTLVEKGTLEVHNRTNIVPFLENMSEIVDCRATSTRVILASDGVEDSQYVRLVKDGARLPMPEEKIFNRCDELQILGLGQGVNSPATTKRLRSEWRNWSIAAGFRTFIGLNDW